jgi:primary-amine oxidase
VFRVVTLAEPPKAQMIPYLDAEHASKPTTPPPPRIALVQFYLDTSSDFREARLDVTSGRCLEEVKLAGKHSYLDTELMTAAETSCLADPDVQEAIKALELPEGAVVCVEPWTYGTDGMHDMSRRIIMVCIGLDIFPWPRVSNS